jgi:hypothetical protein
MAKTLTLEEAAQQLGLSVEQFKLNLKTHKDFSALRPLMGGATMHFREQDIAELSRKLGKGSDAELHTGGDDDQVEIGREPPRTPGSSGTRLSSQSNPRMNKPKAGEPSATDSSDEFIPLTPDHGTTKSGRKRDSDVRVDSGKKSRPPAGTPTEEIDLEAEARKQGKEDVFDLAEEGSKSGKGSGKSSSKSSGKLKSSAKKDEGSEFELKLGTDSDSEFELTLADDSDEVPLGGSSRDATGKTGKSGVKLNRPDDSGISLEKDSDSDFELNLDSSTSKKIVGPKPSSGKNKGKKADSDSEFELALDDSSGEIPSAHVESSEQQKDIFATDFDIPALDDSASEAVALEDSGDTDLESSDFDLDAEAAEVDESASEVVQLDDDLAEGDAVEVDEARSGKRKKRRGGDDDLSAEEALAGVDEDEEEEEMAMAAPGTPARWGPLPALVLFPCLFVMLIISFMGFELLHGMWSYRTGGSKPTYTITKGVAGMFMDLPKD